MNQKARRGRGEAWRERKRNKAKPALSIKNVLTQKQSLSLVPVCNLNVMQSKNEELNLRFPHATSHMLLPASSAACSATAGYQRAFDQ